MTPSTGFTPTELRRLTEIDKKRKEASKLLDFKCSKCGRTAVPSHFVWSAAFDMVDLRMCITCTHWYEFHRGVLAHPKKNFMARDNGYTVGKEKPAWNLSRGFGGALFIIRFSDGNVIESTNLWHRGAVPKAWQEDLPNTAVFLRG